MRDFSDHLEVIFLVSIQKSMAEWPVMSPSPNLLSDADVDADHAGASAFGEVLGGATAGGVDGGGIAIRTLVFDFDGLVQIVGANDGKDGSEDFVGDTRMVRRGAIDNGGPQEIAFGIDFRVSAIDNDFEPVGFGAVDVRGDTCFRVAANNRAHVLAGDDGFGELGHAVEDLLHVADGDNDAGGHAALAGATGEAGQDIGSGHFGIGVGSDDEVVLGAAEGPYAFSLSGGPTVDDLGNASGPNEGNGLNAGMVADGFDDGFAAVHDVENAIGKARFLHQFGEFHGAEGRLLGGFEDEGVAAGNREREDPHGHHGGEVEGRDAGHDPDRLAQGFAFHAGADFEDLALNDLRKAAGELGALDALGDFGAGFGKRLAVFERAKLGESFLVLFQEMAEAVEDLNTFFDGDGTPFFLRVGGRSDGVVQVAGCGLGNPGDGLAGGWLEHGDALPRRGIDGGPINEIGDGLG